MQHGCNLGWLIDPSDRSVLVFLRDRQPEVLSGGDILPVFDAIELELTVNALFSWLKMNVD